MFIQAGYIIVRYIFIEVKGRQLTSFVLPTCPLVEGVCVFGAPTISVKTLDLWFTIISYLQFYDFSIHLFI